MNYRYGILATALAVSLLAIPATAGVTDVSGGQGVEVKTTVRNNYTDTRTNVTNEVRWGDKFVDKSSSTITVKGDLKYQGKINGSNDHRTEYRHFERTSSNPSDLGYLQGLISSQMRDYGIQHQLHRYGVSQGLLNDMYWLNGSWLMGSYYGQTGWSRSESGHISDHRQRTTDKYTEYKENKSKMTTTYDGSKLSYTDTVTEPGTILVGDPDAIFNAYTATGKVTINEIRDDYYTRNPVYERDHIVQDTVTRTGNKHVVYQANATRVYSPIVLDLDGDGKIEASNGQYLAHDTFSDKVVAFDFFGNGFPVLTEWVGANDGLLCRPNADGSVKGTNLFGIANGFDNGYEEMASLDVDNSGSLEGAELKELRVWTDVNGNGIAEANELKTLDELGITSIKVSHNNYASTFVRNGQTFKSFDWWPNCREMRKVDMASVIK